MHGPNVQLILPKIYDNNSAKVILDKVLLIFAT